MVLREVLARNVRKHRARLRLNQDDLADRAQIDRTYVSMIENCKHAASVDVIEQLATAFEVEPADLLKAEAS